MKQHGLIVRVISAVLLDDGMAKVKYTTSGSVTLVKNEDGIPVSGSFNYSSVVLMLLYLSVHTGPDIDFPFNSCASYIFFPRIFMKRIWSKSIGIWNWPGIVYLSSILIWSYSRLIDIIMQIYLACMDMQIRLILPVLTVALVTLSNVYTVLFMAIKYIYRDSPL